MFFKPAVQIINVQNMCVYVIVYIIICVLKASGEYIK